MPVWYLLWRSCGSSHCFSRCFGLSICRGEPSIQSSNSSSPGCIDGSELHHPPHNYDFVCMCAIRRSTGPLCLGWRPRCGLSHPRRIRSSLDYSYPFDSPLNRWSDSHRSRVMCAFRCGLRSLRIPWARSSYSWRCRQPSRDWPCSSDFWHPSCRLGPPRAW